MHYILIDEQLENGRIEKHYICIEHITSIDEDVNRTIIHTTDGKHYINGFVGSKLAQIAVRATDGKVILFAAEK